MRRHTSFSVYVLASLLATGCTIKTKTSENLNSDSTSGIEQPQQDLSVSVPGKIEEFMLSPNGANVIYTTKDTDGTVRLYRSTQNGQSHTVTQIGQVSPGQTFKDVQFVGFPDDFNFNFIADDRMYRFSFETEITSLLPGTDPIRRAILGSDGFIYYETIGSEVFLSRLYRVRFDGFQTAQVDAEGNEFNLAMFGLSPNADRVLYSTGGRVISVNPDGTDRQEIANFTYSNGEGEFPFSPDGNYVAMVQTSFTGGLSQRLHVNHITGGELAQVSFEPADTSNGMRVGDQIVFSSDSQRVYFLHNDDSSDQNVEVYSNNRTGTDLVKISQIPNKRIASFELSPLGDRVVYYHLNTHNSETEARSRLVNGSGLQVLFSSTNEGFEFGGFKSNNEMYFVATSGNSEILVSNINNAGLSTALESSGHNLNINDAVMNPSEDVLLFSGNASAPSTDSVYMISDSVTVPAPIIDVLPGNKFFEIKVVSDLDVLVRVYGGGSNPDTLYRAYTDGRPALEVSQ